MIKQKKYRRKCISCNTTCTKWGKTSAGTTRYYCPNCKKTFSAYQKKYSKKKHSQKQILKKMDL